MKSVQELLAARSIPLTEQEYSEYEDAKRCGYLVISSRRVTPLRIAWFLWCVEQEQPHVVVTVHSDQRTSIRFDVSTAGFGSTEDWNDAVNAILYSLTPYAGLDAIATGVCSTTDYLRLTNALTAVQRLLDLWQRFSTQYSAGPEALANA